MSENEQQLSNISQNETSFVREIKGETLPDITAFVLSHSRAVHWTSETSHRHKTPELPIDPNVSIPDLSTPTSSSSTPDRNNTVKVLISNPDVFTPSGLRYVNVKHVESGYKDSGLNYSDNNTNNNNHNCNCLTNNATTLFRIAAKKELTKQEIELVEKYITSCSLSVLTTVCLTPAFFSSVINSNPEIAVTLLQHVVDTPDDALYFNQLLCQSPQTPMRLLKSLRVVSNVASLCKFPIHFLNRFISIAFQTCASIQDFLPQQQVARLICVFLLDLIQRSFLNPTDDMAPEIQSFAVSWIQLKEAGVVFRALRGNLD